MAGAATDRSLAEHTVVLGELGLGGELRRVSRLEQRLAEAATLGQRTAVVPAAGTSRAPREMRLAACSTLAAAAGLLVER